MGCDDRLVNSTLVMHGLVIPNAVRSTLASAKSRGGSRLSVDGAIGGSLTARQLLDALVAVGSHAGTNHGGALTASQLDGKTELDAVRKRTEEKFQTSLPPEQLTAFLGTYYGPLVGQW